MVLLRYIVDYFFKQGKEHFGPLGDILSPFEDWTRQNIQFGKYEGGRGVGKLCRYKKPNLEYFRKKCIK